MAALSRRETAPCGLRERRVHGRRSSGCLDHDQLRATTVPPEVRMRAAAVLISLLLSNLPLAGIYRSDASANPVNSERSDTSRGFVTVYCSFFLVCHAPSSVLCVRILSRNCRYALPRRVVWSNVIIAFPICAGTLKRYRFSLSLPFSLPLLSPWRIHLRDPAWIPVIQRDVNY